MDKADKYLFDIQHSISLIETFLSGVDDFQTYLKDTKTQSAVERQLAIIGEAVSKLRQIDANIPLTGAKQMIDFRNRLIHSYDNIDASIVWAIIKNHLPLLKQEVNHPNTPPTT